MTRNLEERIRTRVEQTEFGDRLLEIAKRIERDFNGRERDRLLDMVEEALERHVEIRETAERARGELEKLRSDQHSLLQLFDFITANAGRETVH